MPEPTLETTFRVLDDLGDAGAGHQPRPDRPDGQLQWLPQPGAGAKIASSVAEPETIRERGGQLREAGAEYLIVYLPRLAHDLEQMQRFQEEIIPHFAR